MITQAKHFNISFLKASFKQFICKPPPLGFQVKKLRFPRDLLYSNYMRPEMNKDSRDVKTRLNLTQSLSEPPV